MSTPQTSPHVFAFDVEADGPCPGSDQYSMVSLGIASTRDPSLFFYRTFRPISDQWDPEALAVSKFTREQTLAFPPAEEGIADLLAWADARAVSGRPVLVSDNPAFDWQWVNHYCHRFAGRNPFGSSARRLGDLHAGYAGDVTDTRGWKKWRTTAHTHNALDDARGTAEGWRVLTDRMKQARLASPTRTPHTGRKP